MALLPLASTGIGGGLLLIVIRAQGVIEGSNLGADRGAAVGIGLQGGVFRASSRIGGIWVRSRGRSRNGSVRAPPRSAVLARAFVMTWPWDRGVVAQAASSSGAAQGRAASLFIKGA